ncbi:MAG: transglutaminase domain-containing protein [Gammaproteobacteria bacterium]
MSGFRRGVVAALVALAATLAAGCASLMETVPEPEPAPLPEPWATRIAAVEPPPGAAEIMALTPEMRRYLSDQVNPDRFKPVVVRSLTNLLLHPGSLGIDYDAGRTGTAAETFRSRAGNCLSLSILFVALAREAGIDARFQQVEMVPEWDMRDDVLFAARHVNVYGRLSGYGDYVMDFYPYPAEPRGPRHMLSDREAIAQFYNNRGAGYLAEGDYARSWVYLRAAVRQAPAWSDGWSNLALVYQRVGDDASAEAMLRYAIHLAHDNTSAINNLAVLLVRQGRDQEADEWLTRVSSVRERNPYYHYALARRAEREGDFRAALAHIERALELKEDESRFALKAAELTAVLEAGGSVDAQRRRHGAEPVPGGEMRSSL